VSGFGGGGGCCEVFRLLGSFFEKTHSVPAMEVRKLALADSDDEDEWDEEMDDY